MTNVCRHSISWWLDHGNERSKSFDIIPFKDYQSQYTNKQLHRDTQTLERLQMRYPRLHQRRKALQTISSEELTYLNNMRQAVAIKEMRRKGFAWKQQLYINIDDLGPLELHCEDLKNFIHISYIVEYHDYRYTQDVLGDFQKYNFVIIKIYIL